MRAQRPSQVKDDETWGAVEPERGIKSKTDLLRVKRSWDWPGGWGGGECGLKEGNVAIMVPGLYLNNQVEAEDFPKKENSE